MLSRRIIPCLDVNAGRVVKGVKFQELRDLALGSIDHPRDLGIHCGIGRGTCATLQIRSHIIR